MNNSFSKYFLLLILILLFNSCANYKLHISKRIRQSKEQPPTNLQISHTLFLIGNTYSRKIDEMPATLSLLQRQLEKESDNSTVLFLGNLSFRSMTTNAEPQYEEEYKFSLDKQLSIVKNFKGNSIFIPGNRDWAEGTRGIKKLEKDIEEAINIEEDNEELWQNAFLPDKGCGEPVVIELSNQLVLIVIDSYWYLQDWNKTTDINRGCSISSREAFAEAFYNAVLNNQGKNIVIASHHTLRSYGPYGGYFTLKQNLFPTSDLNSSLMFPIPIIGSLAPLLRKLIGVSGQDLFNARYVNFIEAMMAPGHLEELIFVAGHEKSLQYIKDEGHHFIISGSGVNKTPTARNKKAPFTYGHQGFSKINFYEDGSAWLEFWIPDKKSEYGKLLFKQKIKGSTNSISLIPTDFTEYDSLKNIDSIEVRISKFKPKSSKLFSSIYNDFHKIPVLDLKEYKGGLTPIRARHDKQINLRLKAADGQQFVLHKILRDGPNNESLQTFPFAQLLIPHFADAANIFCIHRPKLYYVPKQPVLGQYNIQFGGEVYLFEERSLNHSPELDILWNKERFISSNNLSDKKDQNHLHHVDQRRLVRSRIFDLFIGDLNQTADQWLWAEDNIDGEHKSYYPIPDDHYTALTTDYVNYKSLKKVNNQNRFFDHNFLNELSQEEWIREASFIQQQITEEYIEQVFNNLPKGISEEVKKRMIDTLKKRRNNLQAIAKDFYKHISKRVMIYGSNRDDYFEVIRKNDDETEINLYQSNDNFGKKNRRYYHRIFKTSETKEVFLFGLDGDDIFEISDTTNKGIKLHVIGGFGKDSFINNSKVKGFSKKDNFYDSDKDSKIQLGKEGLSHLIPFNTFNRKGDQFYNDQFSFSSFGGYNPDDGIYLGVKAIYTANSFYKTPFSQRHSIRLHHAFATHGTNVKYKGEFIERNKSKGYLANLEWKSNRHTFNFFGLGNETNKSTNDLDFYRVQQGMTYLDFRRQYYFFKNSATISLGGLLQHSELLKREGRFISSDETGLNPEEFENRWYLGAIGSFNFSRIDRLVFPTRGLIFNTSYNWQTNLSGTDRQFSKIKIDLKMYISIIQDDLVMESRFGVNKIFGNYDFFFLPTLGLDENLRGFVGQRFRGVSNFFQTNDFRLTLVKQKISSGINQYGVVANLDYGRVWASGESSSKLHLSYGFGIWMLLPKFATIAINYYTSSDDNQLVFKVRRTFLK